MASNNNIEELLQDLIIVQLALAGVPGAEIRKVVGVGMNRVSKILKAIKKAQD
jgi:hypothetical protein